MNLIEGSCPVAPRRLIVVDPSLTDFRGHHAQYDISVLEACAAEKIEASVLGHRSVSNSIDKRISVIRTFSEDMWGGDQSIKFGWLDLKLFCLGLLTLVISPGLIRNNLSRLKRRSSVILSNTRMMLGDVSHRDSRALKMLAYLGLKFLPSYRCKGTRTINGETIKSLERFTPPIIWLSGQGFVWLIQKIIRGAIWVMHGIRPPVLSGKKPSYLLVGLPRDMSTAGAKCLFRIIPKALRLIIVSPARFHAVKNSLGAIAPGFLTPFFPNPRYYYEATRGLRDGMQIDAGDMVFFHMVIDRNILETACLCEMIYSKTRIAPVVLLRYPPQFIFNRYPYLAKLAVHKLEWLFENGMIRLASDSDRLITDYGNHTYIPMELLPIPHGKSDLVHGIRILPENKVTTVVSLGNARAEKGFNEIYKMMRGLAASKCRMPVKFIIQANDPDGEASPFVKKFKKTRFPFPVSVITKSLDKDAYEEIVAKSDVILAPYWQEVYASRTSGIALEALVAGKILITTKNTWMSDQVKQWRTGLLVENRDVASLTKATVRAITKRNSLIARAIAVRGSVADFHSGKSFLEHLRRIKRIRRTPEKRACLFYPWNDLFRLKSGASIRSSLVAKKLVQDGWHVTVIANIPKSVKIPRGISAVSWEEPTASFRNPVYFYDFVQRLLFSRGMVGLEDFQYRFRYWMRNRSAKLVVNAVLRRNAAVILEYPFLASLVSQFAKAYEIPMVVNSLDVLSMQTEKTILRNWIMDREVEAFKLGQYSFVISDDDQRCFERFGAQSLVIPNSVDIDMYVPVASDEASRTIAKAGIDLSLTRFGLFVGSAHPPNIKAAMRIFEIARDKLCLTEGIKFVIVGECVDRKAPFSTKNCSYVGRVSASVLRSLYSLAAFVVIPLESGTGSSVKTLEAFAYGKAVIGTRVAFRGYEVFSGEHCVISDDLKEYPQIISEILNDESRSQKIQNNARRFARTRDYRTTFAPIVRAMESESEGCVRSMSERVPDKLASIDSGCMGILE